MKYAAKLLFQYRIEVDGESNKRRLCEERIVLLSSKTAERALVKAKRRGKEEESSFVNDQGNNVMIEFVGVMELLQLGIECNEDEVWYELKERVLPMERMTRFVPAEEDLSAVRLEAKT